MKKVLVVFGTRPEAIKMMPLVKELNKLVDVDTKVCVTGQHREMLDQVLSFFEVTPDFDLDLMKPNQNLYSLTSEILLGLKDVLEEFHPDYVFVHGDTTTTMAASLASFYSGAKVCHIEAGLRTHNKLSPFPEEINRQVTGRIADFHFAPTFESKNNLLKENVSEDQIIVTGNTVIDALLYSVNIVESMDDSEIEGLKKQLDLTKDIILVTGHRRENHGDGFLRICESLKEIAETSPNCIIVYPVHLNPNVQRPVYDLLSEIDNIFLMEPLAYPAFVWLMNKSKIILTDSGGVQEEAPSLGKPVLVMRDTTERPEAVAAGTVLLVGTDKSKIVTEVNSLLEDKERYSSMRTLHNPYGDGTAVKKIVEFLDQL